MLVLANTSKYGVASMIAIIALTLPASFFRLLFGITNTELGDLAKTHGRTRTTTRSQFSPKQTRQNFLSFPFHTSRQINNQTQNNNIQQSHSIQDSLLDDH